MKLKRRCKGTEVGDAGLKNIYKIRPKISRNGYKTTPRKGKRNMIVSTSTDAPKCKKSTPIPMIKSKRRPSRLRDLNRMASTDRSVDETFQPDKQESSGSAPIIFPAISID